MQKALTLALPGNAFSKELTLVDIADPRSWTIRESSGLQHSLAASNNADRFFQEMGNSHKVPLDLIYISVAQDEAGRHCFVCLEDAAQALRQPGENLALIPESIAKSRRETEGAVLLYARPAHEASLDNGVVPGAATSKLVDNISRRHKPPHAASDNELCPKHHPLANYDVIPQLSLGPTQKLILCDEASLTRQMPEERIFEHLSLIVNCHEPSVCNGFYKVGVCGSGRMPKIVCQEVHKWYSLGEADMNRTNDQIQEKIWENLQSGSVAVHCLAGIHRAACIVACHFLWRHYTLRDHRVPKDPTEIYDCLQAARPHVEPAYKHVLESYRGYLQAKLASP